MARPSARAVSLHADHWRTTRHARDRTTRTWPNVTQDRMHTGGPRERPGSPPGAGGRSTRKRSLLTCNRHHRSMRTDLRGTMFVQFDAGAVVTGATVF